MVGEAESGTRHGRRADLVFGPGRFRARGLIAKRLINKFGFPVGNLLQALLFGTLHFALFYPLAGLETLGVLFAYSTAFGWLLGLLKEKVGRGSILPGWVAHGTANLVTYLGLAYGVI